MKIKSDFIRLEKEKLGMSGSDLAKAAGFSRGGISTALAGGNASAKMVLALAKVLDLEPERIIREED